MRISVSAPQANRRRGMSQHSRSNVFMRTNNKSVHSLYNSFCMLLGVNFTYTVNYDAESWPFSQSTLTICLQLVII
uniref:Uncharacterized protein n=1 Tax=Anguilla anguilla TaxID=7936 RepID=A0A0E9XV95_ANGAN